MKPWFASTTILVNGAVIFILFHPWVVGWFIKDPVHVIQFHALWNIIQRFVTNKSIGKPGKLKEES